MPELARRDDDDDDRDKSSRQENSKSQKTSKFCLEGDRIFTIDNRDNRLD